MKPPLHRPLTPLVWTLGLVLLGQALFPLQLHTLVTRDPGGRLVLICTLQGTRALRLDDAGQPLPPRAGRDSPAWLFSQLMAGAAPMAAPPPPLARPAPHPFHTPGSLPAPRAMPLSHAPARAPPLV